jgi:hypothetical protein
MVKQHSCQTTKSAPNRAHVIHFAHNCRACRRPRRCDRPGSVWSFGKLTEGLSEMSDRSGDSFQAPGSMSTANPSARSRNACATRLETHNLQPTRKHHAVASFVPLTSSKPIGGSLMPRVSCCRRPRRRHAPHTTPAKISVNCASADVISNRCGRTKTAIPQALLGMTRHRR